MDIRCPRCAEPWELDSLHEEVNARWPDSPWIVKGKHDQTKYETYLRQVQADFRAEGCAALSAAFGTQTCNAATVGSTAAAVSAALMDMLGDDLDGVASELDDLGYRGLL